jgi:hypothetical protein
MALGVVAVFSSLVEARIACGALQAAGVDAKLFDDHFGSVMWLDQTAIGGFRIVAPADDVQAARVFLREARSASRPRRRDRRDKGVAWRALSVAMGLGLGGAVGLGLGAGAGWFVVAARRRMRGLGAIDLTAFLLAVGLTVTAFVACELAVLFAFALTHPP